MFTVLFLVLPTFSMQVARRANVNFFLFEQGLVPDPATDAKVAPMHKPPTVPVVGTVVVVTSLPAQSRPPRGIRNMIV